MARMLSKADRQVSCRFGSRCGCDRDRKLGRVIARRNRRRERRAWRREAGRA